LTAIPRYLRGITALLAVLLILFLLFLWVRSQPQDFPFAPLDLAEKPGAFTGGKLAGLGRDFPRCRALLDRAGVNYTLRPEVKTAGVCGYADGVRFAADGSRRIAMVPGDVTMACPVAAALAMWEWNVVQPAARRHFGQPVVGFDHLGSYNCRRIAGGANSSWSQHATADAIDIAGFRLADGTRITVLRDWKGQSDKAAFLREVRDGACQLFSMTLSPEYNAAHADHLHLDEGANGERGWRGCH
jgi:hypothetical protein